MKHFIAIIVGLSFLLGGFAMVSVSTMNHEGVHTCPIAQMYGGDCSIVGGVSLALHHIDGLLSLSEVIPATLLLLLLSVIVAGLLVDILPRILQSHGLFGLASKSRAGIAENFFESPIFQIPLRWAALHNKRDKLYVS